MSEFRNCPICGEFDWIGKHQCKPFWFVRSEDYDREDEAKVFANDPEEAAEQYLSERFSDFDYPHSLTVMVINQSENEEYKIEIEVEPVPEFSASIVETKAIEPKQDDTEEANDVPF